MKNITNQRYNRLIAIRFDHKTIRADGIHAEYFWLFKCDCGKEKVFNKHAVISGNSKSCGCFHAEQTSKASKTHGMRWTRFYGIWTKMKARCLNKKIHAYNLYGGRGIKLMWKSFESFRNDMYKSYLEHVKKFGEKQTTIDRINSNGNYEKSNCRWATWREQQNNRRNNHLITFNNKTLSVTEWSRIMNVDHSKLFNRLKSGWSAEQALTT